MKVLVGGVGVPLRRRLERHDCACLCGTTFQGVERLISRATKIFAKSPQIEKDLTHQAHLERSGLLPGESNLSRFVAILRKFWFARKINLSKEPYSLKCRGGVR
jgi:hypothetical protein